MSSYTEIALRVTSVGGIHASVWNKCLPDQQKEKSYCAVISHKTSSQGEVCAGPAHGALWLQSWEKSREKYHDTVNISLRIDWANVSAWSFLPANRKREMIFKCRCLPDACSLCSCLPSKYWWDLAVKSCVCSQAQPHGSYQGIKSWPHNKQHSLSLLFSLAKRLSCSWHLYFAVLKWHQTVLVSKLSPNRLN